MIIYFDVTRENEDWGIAGNQVELTQSETCFALVAPGAVALHDAWHDRPDAPIEATRPCFKCGRTGPSVVDRFPIGMRNHPERFMHSSGLCPEMPDS